MEPDERGKPSTGLEKMWMRYDMRYSGEGLGVTFGVLDWGRASFVLRNQIGLWTVIFTS